MKHNFKQFLALIYIFLLVVSSLVLAQDSSNSDSSGTSGTSSSGADQFYDQFSNDPALWTANNFDKLSPANQAEFLSNNYQPALALEFYKNQNNVGLNSQVDFKYFGDPVNVGKNPLADDKFYSGSYASATATMLRDFLQLGAGQKDAAAHYFTQKFGAPYSFDQVDSDFRYLAQEGTLTNGKKTISLNEFKGDSSVQNIIAIADGFKIIRKQDQGVQEVSVQGDGERKIQYDPQNGNLVFKDAQGKEQYFDLTAGRAVDFKFQADGTLEIEGPVSGIVNLNNDQQFAEFRNREGKLIFHANGDIEARDALVETAKLYLDGRFEFHKSDNRVDAYDVMSEDRKTIIVDKDSRVGAKSQGQIKGESILKVFLSKISEKSEYAPSSKTAPTDQQSVKEVIDNLQKVRPPQGNLNDNAEVYIKKEDDTGKTIVTAKGKVDLGFYDLVTGSAALSEKEPHFIGINGISEFDYLGAPQKQINVRGQAVYSDDQYSRIDTQQNGASLKIIRNELDDVLSSGCFNCQVGATALNIGKTVATATPAGDVFGEPHFKTIHLSATVGKEGLEYNFDSFLSNLGSLAQSKTEGEEIILGKNLLMKNVVCEGSKQCNLMLARDQQSGVTSAFYEVYDPETNQVSKRVAITTDIGTTLGAATILTSSENAARLQQIQALIQQNRFSEASALLKNNPFDDDPALRTHLLKTMGIDINRLHQPEYAQKLNGILKFYSDAQDKIQSLRQNYGINLDEHGLPASAEDQQKLNEILNKKRIGNERAIFDLYSGARVDLARAEKEQLDTLHQSCAGTSSCSVSDEEVKEANQKLISEVLRRERSAEGVEWKQQIESQKQQEQQEKEREHETELLKDKLVDAQKLGKKRDSEEKDLTRNQAVLSRISQEVKDQEAAVAQLEQKRKDRAAGGERFREVALLLTGNIGEDLRLLRQEQELANKQLSSLQQQKFSLEKRIEHNHKALKNINNDITGLTQDFKQPTSKLALLSAYGDDENVGKMIQNSDLPLDKKQELFQNYLGKTVSDKIKESYANRYSSAEAFSQSEKQINEILGNGKTALRQAQNYAQYYGDIAGSKAVLDHVAAARPDLVDSPEWRAAQDSYNKAVDNRLTELKEIAQQNLQDKINLRDGKESSIFGNKDSIADQTISALGTGVEKLGAGIRFVSMKTVAGTLYAAGGISQVITKGQAGESLLDAATALHHYDDAKHAQADAEINALNQEIKSYDKLRGLLADARNAGKEPDLAQIQNAFKFQAPVVNLAKQMQGQELTVDDHAKEALYTTEQHALVAGGDELVTNEYRAIAAEYGGKSDLANVAFDKVLQAGQIAEGSFVTKEDLALYGDPIIDVTVDVTNLIPGVAFVKAGEITAKVAEVTKVVEAFAEVGKAVEAVKDAGKLFTVSNEARLTLRTAKAELEAAQITKGLTVAERTAEIARAEQKVTLAAQTAEAEYRATKVGKAGAFLSTPVSSDLRAIEKLRIAAQEEQFASAQKLQKAVAVEEAHVAQQAYQAAAQKVNDLDKAKQAYSVAGSDLGTLFEGTALGKQRAVGPAAEKAQQALDDFQQARQAYHTEKIAFGADKVSQATIDNVITAAKAAEKASFENRVSDAIRGAIGVQRVERNVEQLKAAEMVISFTKEGKLVAEGVQEGSEEAKLVENTNKLLEDPRVVQRVVGDDASRLAKPENVPAPSRKLSAQEFTELETLDKELEARGATYKLNDQGIAEINIDNVVTADAKDLDQLKQKAQRVEQLSDQADKDALTKQLQVRRNAEAVLADNDLQQIAKDVKNDLAAKAKGKTDAGVIPEVAGEAAAELPKPLAKTEARIATGDDIPRPSAIEEAIDSRSAGTVSILRPAQQEGTVSEVAGLDKLSSGVSADENAQKVLSALPEAGGEVKVETLNGNVYRGTLLSKDDNVIRLDQAGRERKIVTGKVTDVEVIETPNVRGVSDNLNPCNLVPAAIYGLAPCAKGATAEVVEEVEEIPASTPEIPEERLPELEGRVHLDAENAPTPFQRQIEEGRELERLLDEAPVSEQLYQKATLDSHGAQKLPVFENNLPPRYTLYEISMDRSTVKGLNDVSYELGTEAISTQHRQLVAFAEQKGLPVTTLQKTTYIAVPESSATSIDDVLAAVENARSSTSQATGKPIKLRVGAADNADTLMETRLRTKRSLEFAEQTNVPPTNAKYGDEVRGWYEQLPVEQKANVNDIFAGYDEALKEDFAKLNQLKAEGKTEEYKQKLAQLAIADLQDAKFSNLPIVKKYQADPITGVREGDAVVSTDGISLGQQNKEDVLDLTRQNLPDDQLASQLGRNIDNSITNVNEVIKETYLQAVDNVNLQPVEVIGKYDEIARVAKYPGGSITNTDELKNFLKWEFEHRGRFRGGDETFMTLRQEVLAANPDFAGTLQRAVHLCETCDYGVRVGFKEVGAGENYAEAIAAADQAVIASKKLGNVPVVVDRHGNVRALEEVSSSIPTESQAGVSGVVEPCVIAGGAIAGLAPCSPIKIKLTSAIGNDKSLTRLATEAGEDKRVQDGLDHLFKEVSKGNFPGRIRSLEGTSVLYVGNDKARLYLRRIGPDQYEIVGRSTKGINQDQVINRLQKLYGRCNIAAAAVYGLAGCPGNIPVSTVSPSSLDELQEGQQFSVTARDGIRYSGKVKGRGEGFLIIESSEPSGGVFDAILGGKKEEKLLVVDNLDTRTLVVKDQPIEVRSVYGDIYVGKYLDEDSGILRIIDESGETHELSKIEELDLDSFRKISGPPQQKSRAVRNGEAYVLDNKKYLYDPVNNEWKQQRFIFEDKPIARLKEQPIPPELLEDLVHLEAARLNAPVPLVEESIKGRFEILAKPGQAKGVEASLHLVSPQDYEKSISNLVQKVENANALTKENIKDLVLHRARAEVQAGTMAPEHYGALEQDFNLLYERSKVATNDVATFAEILQQQRPGFTDVHLFRDGAVLGASDELAQRLVGVANPDIKIIYVSRDTTYLESEKVRVMMFNAKDQSDSFLEFKQKFQEEFKYLAENDYEFRREVNAVFRYMENEGLIQDGAKLRFIDTCCSGSINYMLEGAVRYYRPDIEVESLLMESNIRFSDGTLSAGLKGISVEGLSKPTRFSGEFDSLGAPLMIPVKSGVIIGDEKNLITNYYGEHAEQVLSYLDQLVVMEQTAERIKGTAPIAAVIGN